MQDAGDAIDMIPTTPLVPDHPAPLTKQAIFDIAWKWSRAHPRCANYNGVCFYRSPDGQNACLIGAIIPDSRYKGEFERRGIDCIYSCLSDLFDQEIAADPGWLCRLQKCHDRAWGGAYLVLVTEHLLAFASQNNLSIPS